MGWPSFPYNGSFLKTGMWLMEGSFCGFCGQMSQWVGKGLVGISPDVTDNPGSQTQWIATKKNRTTTLWVTFQQLTGNPA